MENPLTKEQVEEINAISKLPAGKQREALQEFTKKLSSEQIEFLRKQQETGCVFCSIVEGKIESKKVYGDDRFLGVLDINPANKGHVILFPKKHYEVLAQMEDVSELFNLANNIGKAVFETVKAEGTSILVNNGRGAGQIVPHVVVNIIPRFGDDKVNFGWEKKEISEEEMDNLASEISKKVSVPKKGEKMEERKIKAIKIKSESFERIP